MKHIVTLNFQKVIQGNKFFFNLLSFGFDGTERVNMLNCNSHNYDHLLSKNPKLKCILKPNNIFSCSMKLYADIGLYFGG